MAEPKPLVVVANPADGGVAYWLLKFYGFGLLIVSIAVVASLPALYLTVAARTPQPRDISSYADWADVASHIYAGDGRLLQTLVKERRELVNLDQVPPLLAKAFLAAEDRGFFSHGGVNFKGIARAAWTNLKAGRVRQGGSTITQQVAKTQLTNERTAERKLKELVLARRIEARFTKRQILQYYLNHIFLGNNAYGIAAAADAYFGKSLDRLSLPEMALLAGLAQAPSRYSPRASPQKARRRRNRVLRMMHNAGFISREQCDAAQQEPITLTAHRAKSDDQAPWVAPYPVATVQRDLVRRYGKERIYGAGWRISTAVDLAIQALARKHVLIEARALDKRQGWRGPEQHYRTPQAKERVLKRLDALYDTENLRPNRPYLALVTDVSTREAQARIGKHHVKIALARMRWAAPYSRIDAENNKEIESVRDALHVGDLIWAVSPPRWARHGDWGHIKQDPTPMGLHQRPRIEGSLFLYDHHTGYVLAMIGGLDFDRSSFNRTVQACRQPGSTFKPIYYSLALDGNKHSMASVLQDKPYVPEPGEQWNPQNVHGTLDGEVSLHYALVKSLNLPSIQLLNRVGAQHAADWAKRLGITTELIADKGLALGASCVHMDELARSFAVFARGGTILSPVHIRQIHDRHGILIEDHTTAVDPLLNEDERLDRFWATARIHPRRVISKQTAFLTAKLLRDSVRHGIAARCRGIPAPTAGKGGTSSDTLDVWFVGFSSQWTGLSWLGDDTSQRPLGAKEASYTSAIPLFARFMRYAVGKRPHQEIPAFSATGLRKATVDALNGGPPQPDHPTVEIYYKPGTYTP